MIFNLVIPCTFNNCAECVANRTSCATCNDDESMDVDNDCNCRNGFYDPGDNTCESI